MDLRSAIWLNETIYLLGGMHTQQSVTNDVSQTAIAANDDDWTYCPTPTDSNAPQ